MTPDFIAPAPWKLTGDGLVFVAHFPASFVRQNGFLAEYQRGAYKGVMGAVMLVDYHTSGVGPYRELLFIPGLFKLGGKWGLSISKIYVSTYDSVWNGFENWGIPKELADFAIVHNADGTRRYRVSANGVNFLDVLVKPWGPRFPVSTKLMPLFRLLQKKRGEMLLTRPVASGKGQLVSVKDMSVKSAYFPQIGRIRPLAVMAVEDFRMTFPVAKRI
ncbi:acetoacetate decarboxylase family protein [Tellurirhabdus rosea]|uniref:acetoacetate decarboxylase family protein n=1 Tax=Tellurirhabdus rosea TaxID=2674997 RepID=UPI0022593836|nr:acetoacetate decarboxylase family protein [Tellurirhabdus rosea]